MRELPYSNLWYPSLSPTRQVAAWDRLLQPELLHFSSFIFPPDHGQISGGGLSFKMIRETDSFNRYACLYTPVEE